MSNYADGYFDGLDSMLDKITKFVKNKKYQSSLDGRFYIRAWQIEEFLESLKDIKPIDDKLKQDGAGE